MAEIDDEHSDTVAVGFRTRCLYRVGDIAEIAVANLDADRVASEDGTLRTVDEFADLMTATCEGRSSRWARSLPAG